MPTEREIAAMRAAEPFSDDLPDRDLTSPVTVYLSAAERAALDGVVARESWVYRSAFIRSLVTAALRQRGAI